MRPIPEYLQNLIATAPVGYKSVETPTDGNRAVGGEAVVSLPPMLNSWFTDLPKLKGFSGVGVLSFNKRLRYGNNGLQSDINDCWKRSLVEAMDCTRMQFHGHPLKSKQVGNDPNGRKLWQATYHAPYKAIVLDADRDLETVLGRLVADQMWPSMIVFNREVMSCVDDNGVIHTDDTSDGKCHMFFMLRHPVNKHTDPEKFQEFMTLSGAMASRYGTDPQFAASSQATGITYNPLHRLHQVWVSNELNYYRQKNLSDAFGLHGNEHKFGSAYMGSEEVRKDEDGRSVYLSEQFKPLRIPLCKDGDVFTHVVKHMTEHFRVSAGELSRESIFNYCIFQEMCLFKNVHNEATMEHLLSRGHKKMRDINQRFDEPLLDSEMMKWVRYCARNVVAGFDKNKSGGGVGLALSKKRGKAGGSRTAVERLRQKRDRQQRILKRLREGLNQRQIAKEMGMHHCSVSRTIRRLISLRDIELAEAKAEANLEDLKESYRVSDFNDTFPRKT